ncbi:related to D-lactate dehydrogenase [cytochrome], mitochondrial [Hanseniaspora guilliermondii]|uniref:D-lactate dehydrogenase (cytochrome) n=1 Tax=Hanseniaspora guilliermondii TaxID=56406 RepID=A0A1L0B0Q6_9ASCO|nr:related to D-lactate dehydrogenase [cytochrome], mitochondrial [Hanseniaspora guilliermondii]
MFINNIIKSKIYCLKHARSYATKTKPSSSTFKYIAGGVFLGAGATLLYTNFSKESSFSTSNKSTIKVSELPKRVYGSEKMLEKAIEELKTKINPNNITQHPDTILSHADNGCNPIKPLESQKPQYVLYAESTEDVSEILKIMHKYKIPTIPYGGGTSLEQHFFTTRENSVVLDTSRMNKILQINEVDLDASVQCGVTWNQLNETLAELPISATGGSCLMFGCDCGLNANISGMIATNASGIGAQKHGSMVQNVISITAVLADGTIVKTKQRPRKSSAGYNLTGLFSGSEGTLGIVTECTVKLTVVNPIETVCVVQFDDLYKAVGAVSKFAQRGLVLDAIEMLDSNMMKAVNFSSQVNQTFEIKPTLFMKLSGINNLVVDEMVKEVKQISEEQECNLFKFAKDKAEEKELFAARKNALWIMLDYGYDLFGDDVKLWITDAAVPLSKAPEYLKRANEIVDNAGLTSVTVAHLGAGNFHIDIYYQPEQLAVCEKVVKDMCKLSIELEGTITGEHGIGLGKKELLPLELGEPAIDLMRNIKLSMDPHAILNPDKVIKIDNEENFNGTWSGKY